MPSLIKEVTQGQSRTKDQGGEQSNASASRVFRVVLNQPGEQFDEQSACNVSIGDPHPADGNLLCASYSTAYDGSSRMVVLVTFTYQPQKQQQDQDQPPDARPANWSISSAIYERPVSSWRQRIGRNPLQWGQDFVPATNPVGDIYDGVTAMSAIITITIQQWETSDPTRHAQHVGEINDETIALGTLNMRPHTVMLRGVQSTATVEEYGGEQYRGWIGTYEFAYKENVTSVNYPGQAARFDDPIGWDIAVPVTGMNVTAYNPAAQQDALRPRDPYGQPLRHGDEDDPQYAWRVKPPLALPVDTNPGDTVRAMVKVFSFKKEGTTQLPSAMPIALNDDGTPRLVKPSDQKYPLVYVYQVHTSINFTNTLGLRLF